MRSFGRISRFRAVPKPLGFSTRSSHSRSLAVPRSNSAVTSEYSSRGTHYFPSPALHRPAAFITSRQFQSRCFSSSSSDSTLRKTPLYDLHLAHGAKMVPFGGFHMPVQYASQSVSASHIFTRTKASLFDVSHMVQRHIKGAGAAAFLQTITPSNLESLPEHNGTLSALLWKTGGICDDTIITKLGPDLFYIVTNAGCREKDDKFFHDEIAAYGSRAVEHEELEGWGLLALQGPLSKDILAEVLADKEEADLPGLLFGSSLFARIKLRNGELSEPLLISRGGYTGEDGFEISVPPDETVAVAETLLEVGTPERLQLAGLGARDSLRLEAGMCLYGHDLDDSTTPVEAAFSWIIPKDRREGNNIFHGADVILPQLTPRSKGGQGVERRRIGLVVTGAPAREGADIVSSDGDVIGNITSGCPSPTLGKNIAMGYVKEGFHKSGTELGVVVRGKRRDAVVTKMPFVPTKYWKGPPPPSK